MSLLEMFNYIGLSYLYIDITSTIIDQSSVTHGLGIFNQILPRSSKLHVRRRRKDEHWNLPENVYVYHQRTLLVEECLVSYSFPSTDVR